ncbi:sigma factor-like helix-turn-helix DNA-binding protein [Novosphingobium sp. PS1R-30]|uniref:Sigma factor-like helix-turn-helix DNA-binding protein n=1 Tax=Novosphingobium anseongense TaxID=3133436 RepID=A0ABU8S296_9SPHN
MTGSVSPRRFGRRGRRALRRMTKRQRAIFLAMRFEDGSYPELAARHGIGVRQVEAEFAAALLILVLAFRDPEPWWRRL